MNEIEQVVQEALDEIRIEVDEATENFFNEQILVAVDYIDQKELAKSLLIIKLGTDDRPASEEDLQQLECLLSENKIKALPKDTNYIVTHHAFNTEMFRKADLEEAFLIVRIGCPDYPPSSEDIINAKQSFEAADCIPKSCRVVVVPCTTDIDYICNPVIDVAKQFCDEMKSLQDGILINPSTYVSLFEKALAKI